MSLLEKLIIELIFDEKSAKKVPKKQIIRLVEEFM